MATLAASRVFQPSSAIRTFWIADSRTNGGNGGRACWLCDISISFRAADLIGPLIDQFHRAYPGIGISFFETSQEGIEDLLIDDRLDLAIAFSPVQNSEIGVRPLFQETLSFVVGEHHRLAARRKSLTVKAFAAEPLVLLNQNFATRHHIDAFCSMHGCAPNVAVEVNSIGALVDIVHRGKLGTVLPQQVTASHGQLLSIALDQPLPQRQAAVLLRTNAYRSAASTMFINMLTAF